MLVKRYYAHWLSGPVVARGPILGAMFFTFM